MADTIAKTPSAAEPQGDYMIQVVDLPASSAPPRAKGDRSARVFLVDETGQKFDKHGIRIGRWEMAPCGDDCVPNVCMAWCLPCVSAAQISHRLGGSYMGMLLAWGIAYCLMGFASSMARSSMPETYVYRSEYSGNTYLRTEPQGPAPVLWSIVQFICGLIWIMITLNLRSSVRRTYQIPGNCCGDCICAMCFPCCALSQMATHIKSYKPGSCDFGPSADALPAYDADDNDNDQTAVAK